MADVGVWSIDGDVPRRVSRAGVGPERELEDWIARDASLLADGLHDRRPARCISTAGLSTCSPSTGETGGSLSS